MSTRKDFLGQDLEIGNFVVYGTTMNKSRGMVLAKVVKFTPKMVCCEREINKKVDKVYETDMMKVDDKVVFTYKINR